MSVEVSGSWCSLPTLKFEDTRSEFNLFPQFPMAAEMVKSATSEKLMDMDWNKNIEICELVAKDHGQAKDVLKCVKKRLGHKNANTQLFTVRLLEMLMNNCGEHIHRQVIDTGLLPILVKIVKRKVYPFFVITYKERIFLLLDATQTSLGGAKGRFPQYYAAYYDLVASRVQFPLFDRIQSAQDSQSKEINEHSKDLSAEVSQSNGSQEICSDLAAKEPRSEPDKRIIHKATCVMEVLKETLNALATRHSEGAADEFILDLVEQCSFQKQRVMHLVMTCHDEKVIAHAIDLNEQLGKVLTLHDSLLPSRAPTTSLFINEEAEENEEFLRRACKGKALADDNLEFLGSSLRHNSDGDFRRFPLRPLCIQPMDQDDRRRLLYHSVGSIPPPPAKQIERERFFKEKHLDVSGFVGNMRGMSVHSPNGSSSRSVSTDLSNTSGFHD
ncbi:TOM1-like protein 2 [Phalaenopsis equestris]|uniref:TOM1-like protein 2 n=1 Tax=Phalaenopsis equestris TaxID=78828 RepID=UPI0009E2033A|nr:TOM1-like protein 2 [Phalaenopsis equestris]